MSGRRAKAIRRTAAHRPAVRRRRNRHDEYIAVEAFSGYGGMTQGIEAAGFTTILAANHNEYKVEVHEANHPEAEHWIADLVDPDSSDYQDVREFPAADIFTAGVSCVNHSPANSLRAYEQQASLWQMEDQDYDDRVTRSERDRATANCVLHYAATHHPLLILVECTTELQSWGKLVPGSKKVGDGSTYRWWLKQFELLGYERKVLFLNSMFFGLDDRPAGTYPLADSIDPTKTPQDRNRGFWCWWKKHLPAPDLEHRPISWCQRCTTEVEAVWTWRTGPTPTGQVRHGVQYVYRCPSCRSEVVPPHGISLTALDLSNLGQRIGDMPLKKITDKKTGEVYEATHARSTLARAQRCMQRFYEFPAVLMPAKAIRGSERHPWQPMATQTSQQETALLSTGAVMVAAGNTFERPGSDCRSRGLDEPLWSQTATNATGVVTPPIALAIDNYQGAPRGADEPLPTQAATETMAIVSAGVLPYRKHTIPTTHAEAMPTVTADQIPGLLTAGGFIKNNGDVDEAKYRAHPLSSPLGTVTSTNPPSLLFSGWFKQNGSEGTETAAHGVDEPLGTLTSRDTTGMLHAEWRAALSELELEDCYFRMTKPHEIGRGCGFDVDFGDHKGSFIVWGSDRDQVDGYGNAVTPAIPLWIGRRLRAVLHGEPVAA
jgi:DNA (cytosine-5)-methyltransferase 1